MNTRLELGRWAGVTIYLDMFFVLVAMLFTHRYFTSGDAQMMSAGVVVVIGLLASVLLHELGHAFTGMLFKQRVNYVELTGLGGVCVFVQSLPRSILLRTSVYLAGPVVNLLLWLGCQQLAIAAGTSGKVVLAQSLAVLSYANLSLLIFNLMPAYPLDGGQTLDTWLGPILGPAWSVRVVASLGLLVTAGLVYLAFPSGIFMLFVALFLFQANWGALQSVGGFTGRR